MASAIPSIAAWCWWLSALTPTSPRRRRIEVPLWEPRIEHDQAPISVDRLAHARVAATSGMTGNYSHCIRLDAGSYFPFSDLAVRQVR